MAVCQAAIAEREKRGANSRQEGMGLNPPSCTNGNAGHGVDTTDTTGPSGPQIVILGVAGSSPVSHPISSPIGAVRSCVADVRRGEPSDEYHKDSVWRNCSSIKVLLDSVVLYYARFVARTLPPLINDGIRFGSLLHDWFEHGDSIRAKWAVPPDSTLTPTGLLGKDAKNWLETEAPAGATLVSPKDYAQLEGAIEAIKRHPAAMDLLARPAERELSVRWQSDDGHLLRCRFDLLTTDGIVVDLKTTRETDILANFWKSVIDFKYHVQDAWYRRGMEACGMAPAPLRFIVVSSSPPHDCQVVTLPDALVQEGAALMDRALAELRLREDLDWWLPDQHGEVVELPVPAFALRRN